MKGGTYMKLVPAAIVIKFAMYSPDTKEFVEKNKMLQIDSMSGTTDDFVINQLKGIWDEMKGIYNANISGIIEAEEKEEYELYKKLREKYALRRNHNAS
jgi:hypothetical protein